MRIRHLIVFWGAVYLAVGLPVLQADEKQDETVRISAPTMPFLPPLTTEFYGGKYDPDQPNQNASVTSGDAPVESSYGFDEVFFVCGDGHVDPNEECDDGNRLNFDGCSSLCFYENDLACGNGRLDSGEACDDGNTFDGDSCSSLCQIQSVCSDGIVSAGEECDDGNTVPGDGCSQKCTREEKIVFPVDLENPDIQPEKRQSDLDGPAPKNQENKGRNKVQTDKRTTDVLDELDITDDKLKKVKDVADKIVATEDGSRLHITGDSVILDSLTPCTAGETTSKEVTGTPVFSGEQKGCNGSCSVRIEYDSCTGEIISTIPLTSTFSVSGGTYSTASGVFQCQSGAPTVVTYDVSNETQGGSAAFGSRATITDCRI